MSRVLMIALISSLCIAVAAREAGARRSQQLVLRAETFADDAMTAPSTTFAPGSTIFYRLTVRAPSDVQNKVARVTVNAKAVVAGITIPYNFETTLSVPVVNPLDPSRSLGITGSDQIQTGRLKVPRSLPSGTLHLKATVRVANLGDVTARNTIHIER